MKIFGTEFSIKWLETGIKEKESIDWVVSFSQYMRFVKKSSKVLEIGASHAARTKQLARECDALTGLEILPERKPSDFDNARFILGNWEKLSEVFEPESFDIILASHVIEHVEHDRQAIEELHKALKPGGVAIISTPNRERLAARIGDLFKGKRKFPWHEHFREYTEEDLKQLILGIPFTDHEIIPVGLGITGWKLFMYIHPVPRIFRGLCGFWVTILRK